MIVNVNAPHRNWMPNIKHLEAFRDTELPLPETFYDDYATRLAAARADMRINDMYLSYDFKLQKGFYEKETGTGGNLEYAADIENNWKGTYERLTEEQRKAWDAHYNVENEKFRKENLSGKELLQWKYQAFIKDYLRCILSIDENVGRLLDYLDKTQLTEDTIVIYTSDQGFYLGEHGWYDKRFMYEESLRMPLLMRYPPAIKPKQVSEDMVLNLDFAPTVLDFAGVQIPADMQGASFRSLTRGATPGNWRTSMYYHYYEYPHGWHHVKRHYGIRTTRYKLIHFYNDVDVWELYDLQADPHELHNRYDDPAYADLMHELKTELKNLQRKYDDTEAM
jgi:arylsulfatase A-like enzyme